jgi:hypothetical protein
MANAGSKMSINQRKYDYSYHYFEYGMLGWHKQNFQLITNAFVTTFFDKQMALFLILVVAMDSLDHS